MRSRGRYREARRYSHGGELEKGSPEKKWRWRPKLGKTRPSSSSGDGMPKLIEGNASYWGRMCCDAIVGGRSSLQWTKWRDDLGRCGHGREWYLVLGIGLSFGEERNEEGGSKESWKSTRAFGGLLIAEGWIARLWSDSVKAARVSEKSLRHGHGATQDMGGVWVGENP